MKRSLIDVDYSSSGDEEGGALPKQPEGHLSKVPPPKRLKSLPALPSTLVVSSPKDDPALHQGRQRTRPHVEGQFAGHVYVPVSPSKRLRSLLQGIVSDASDVVPELRSLIPDDELKAKLHISISRPVYLRAHQRDAFRVALESVSRNISPFDISCANLVTLVNDEKTRIFLCVEVGAGHSELKTLAEALTPTLRELRQEVYYAAPRFHFSIAWALLSTSNYVEEQQVAQDKDEDMSRPPQPSSQFPAVSKLPDGFLSRLSQRFAGELQAIGRFTANRLEAKIGKDIFTFRLGIQR